MDQFVVIQRYVQESMESRSPRCLRRVCDVHSTGNNKNAAKNIMHGMFRLRFLRFNSVFAVNQISEVIPPWGKSVFDCLISSKFCAKTVIRLTDLLTRLIGLMKYSRGVWKRCVNWTENPRDYVELSYQTLLCLYYKTLPMRCKSLWKHWRTFSNALRNVDKRWHTVENALRMHWKSLSMHWKSIDNALKNGSTVVSVKGRFRK